MTPGKKPALGRGLSALLPGKEDVPRGTQREVAIDQLTPSRFQPRRDFSEAALADLTRSIREQGIVQPIVVVPKGAMGDSFEIVAGERRWRAARLAGLDRVPIVVRERTSDRELLELALVENLQREDLNALEAAEAYARLREEFQLTQEQIADRVGKERATVANSLRLLKLSMIVKDRVRSGELSAGHAKALLALSAVDDQERLAEEIVRRALSVRQAEKRAATMAAGDRVVTTRRRDPFTRDAEEKLTRRLQTKVRIVRKRRGGRIELAFGSEEELIGLFENLMKNQWQ
jgi:ParB family transcriptional regulator, chromosome partitioning protein